MKRELTPEEARDEKLAELTKQNFDARWALLKLGDPRTVVDVCNSVLDYLTHAGDLPKMVQAATIVQSRFGEVVRKMVLEDAEVDALRELEQQEQQHQ